MGWAGGLPGCVKTDEALGWLDSWYARGGEGREVLGGVGRSWTDR